MGPWAPRHCRGCRWLVTPLAEARKTTHVTVVITTAKWMNNWICDNHQSRQKWQHRTIQTHQRNAYTWLLPADVRQLSETLCVVAIDDVLHRLRCLLYVAASDIEQTAGRSVRLCIRGSTIHRHGLSRNARLILLSVVAGEQTDE